MNTKIMVLIATLLLSFHFGKSQSTNSPVPTSPEAYSFMKMVAYPVNLNTGIPDISVPFYQAESGDLKLSVGISYHSGGFKLNEQSTSVGLGWSLTSDIQISRVVNGLDDFKPVNGYLANSRMKTFYTSYGACVDCDYPFYSSVPFSGYHAAQLANGVMDGMPDKFSYRLLNKSGVFYFAKSNDGTGYFILPMPYDNIKIKYDDGRFVITDTDGTVYYFGTSGPLSLTNPAAQGFEVTQTGGLETEVVKTTWKCMEIQNATRTEKINFTYQAKTLTSRINEEETIEYYNNENPMTIGSSLILNNQPVYPGTTEYEHLLQQYSFYQLSSPKYMLNYNNRSVFYLPYLDNNNQVVNRTFTKPYSNNSPVVEIYGAAPAQITFRGGSITFNGADQLNSIVVRDVANNEIKTVEFNSDFTTAFDMNYARQHNWPGFQGTLYLNRLRMKNQGEEFETYGFNYDKFCFGGHLKGSNAWGYPNIETNEGWMNNGITVPKKKITQTFYKSTYSPGNDYVPNVIFNIGESNELVDEGKLAKGMLRRIIYPTGGYADFDFEPNLYKETVNDYSGSYPLVQIGGGMRIRSITMRDGKTLKVQSQKYYRYGELEEGLGLVMNSPPRTFSSGNYTFDGFNYKQNLIYYKNASGSCYTKGCLTAFLKEIKTTFKNTASFNYTYPNGSPIYYTRVTEYDSDLGTQTGKKVHKFFSPSRFDMPRNLMGVIPGTNVPVLISESVGGVPESITDYKFESGAYKYVHSKQFSYTKYQRPEQSRVAYAFAQNVYVPVGGNIPSIEPYNANESFASGSIAIGSDFTVGSYGLESAKLLLTSEREKWVNGVDTLFETKEYSYMKLPYVQPTKLTTINSKGQQISVSYKYAYDYPGVAIYDQMKSDLVNMVSLPVEQTVTNESESKELSRTLTNYASISQGSGFIAPLTIQKSVNGGSLETEMSFKYNQHANIVEMTGKDRVPKSYLWGYNYKYPVAEFTGANYETATSSINIGNFQSITDEVQLKNALFSLRAANPDAMVSTYTYKPLRGVSSITTANGAIKSFLYDNYGRLQTVKDNNGHVLEKYAFRTGDQDPSLFGISFIPSIPMMATFTQLCEPGLIRPYNYIVEGGKYQDHTGTMASSGADYFLYNSALSSLGTGTNGFSPSQLATVKTRTTFYTALPYPNNAYLDLLQHESIAGTHKFPYQSTSYPENQFVMLPGSYTLSFRQDPIYGGVVIKYFVSTSTGDSYYVKHGDSINLQAGVTYTIAITNQF